MTYDTTIRDMAPLVLGLLLSIAAPAIARADAIHPSPCDEGWTFVRHGHGGACEPVACGSSCSGDCVEVARCFETVAEDRGDAPPDEPRSTYERPLPALCDANGACGGGAHCTRTRECRPSHGGCSVSLAATSAAPPWTAILLALFVRAWRRSTARRERA